MKYVSSSLFLYGVMLGLAACSATGPADSGADADGGALGADASGSTDAAASQDAASSDAADAPPTRVFVTLVSHNENTNAGGNAACVAFYDNLDTRYAANRAALLDIADRVVTAGAAWGFQSDTEYLDIVAAREPTSDNIVRQLATMSPAHISVDAHAHETPGKNYADVANALRALAGVRNGIIGGYLIDTCDGSTLGLNWDKFRDPQQPISGGAPLVATALTLAASPGHRCPVSASGVWRPASTTDPYTDDPSQTLVSIGPGLNGMGLVDGLAALRTLLDDMRSGRLEPGRMYTASVVLPQCEFDLAASGVTPADVSVFLDAVNAEVAKGDVEWATFPQILSRWRGEYNSVPSVWTGQ